MKETIKKTIFKDIKTLIKISNRKTAKATIKEYLNNLVIDETFKEFIEGVSLAVELI